MISILIPTYNDDCVSFAHTLMRQCSDIPGLEWELIVGDDGSICPQVIETNRQIDTWPHCRYWLTGVNRGRAAIRNELAKIAKGQWLLMVDADLKVLHHDYISKYVAFIKESTQPCACCGGYQVGKGSISNLRYRYEKSVEKHQSASFRLKAPYQNFKLSNTLIYRTILLEHPLNEHILHYGYEDVMFGIMLKKAGVPVVHLDNPVLFDRFESNLSFVEKIEASIEVLTIFRNELKGYSTLLTLVGTSNGHILSSILYPVLSFLHSFLKKNLLSCLPSLFALRLYKLYLLIFQLKRFSRPWIP